MSREVTYVIGHKSPDTDSICSAIGLAELKTAEGAKNIFAARAGDVNPQTAFILDYFKVQPPRYLPNVYTKAKDVMSTDVVRVSEDTPLFKVMELMREEKVRFIPVLDSGGRPTGTITLMDLAQKYFVRIEAESFREISTTLGNIRSTLNADVILNYLPEDDMSLSVYVAAMARDSFLRAIEGIDVTRCAVIVGDRVNVQRAAIEKGIKILIITGGLDAEPSVIEEARNKGVTVLVSPYDSATTALLVKLSRPAKTFCSKVFASSLPDEQISELKLKLSGTSGLVVLDEDGVMEGIITKTNLLEPSRTNLILVDHNELSQAVDGAEGVNIVEVIDHHRIGNFHSTYPIPFICDPVGSTSTLVAELYQRRNVPIKKEIAGILMGGVLSDTVILRSPTTTERDKAIIKWLEERSGVDHKAFGNEMFSATSSLKKRGAEAAVNGDYKVFEAKGRKFGIGQVETIGFEEFFEEREKIAAELKRLLEKKDLKMSALLITDIAMGTSLFLAMGEKEVIMRLDYPRVTDSVYELKNVLSRKKQVVPHILSIFNEVY